MSVTARAWIRVVLLLCALASTARADDPALAQPKEPNARLHFTRGNRLYRARKLEDAVAAYQAGAALEPAPVFDFNLGQCYRKLGRSADAIRHYERFLERGRPASQLHDLVTSFLRQMSEAQDREQPLLQPPPPVASLPRSPVDRTGAVALPTTARSTSIEALGERWYVDRLGWGLVAGGVATAGVAVYLRMRASDLHATAGAVLDEDRRLELRDAAHVRSAGGAVLGVGGGVLLVAGTIRLAFHLKAAPRLRAASWHIDLSSRGAAVFGRF
jgi:tetratricopeptide (TPR) repeat protein